MKKIIILLIFLLCPIMIFAKTYWSSDVLNVNYLQKEDRFKFYKVVEENITYENKKIENKEIDYSNFILEEKIQDNFPNLVPFEEVEIINDEVKIKDNLRNFIGLNSISVKDKLVINEFNIYYQNMLLEYEIVVENNVEYESDNIILNPYSEFTVKLNKFYNLNDLKIEIKFENVKIIPSLTISFLLTKKAMTEYKKFELLEVPDSKFVTFVYNDTFHKNNSYTVIKYKYYIKKYKTYNLINKYLEGYYKDKSGYIKDNNSRKTYYLYSDNVKKINKKMEETNTGEVKKLNESENNIRYLALNDEVINKKTKKNNKAFFLSLVIIIFIIVFIFMKVLKICRTK